MVILAGMLLITFIFLCAATFALARPDLVTLPDESSYSDGRVVCIDTRPTFRRRR